MVIEMKQWLIGKGGIYVLVQFALFGVIWIAPDRWLGAWVQPWSTLGLVVGALLTLYGVVVLGMGMVNLGRNLQAEPHPKEDATLVTSGAYRIVRHPIYSGIILGWTGWGLFNHAELTTLLAFFLLFPFFDIKTRREERMLSAKFPPYAAYQRRVRKLIPYLY
jgi:protein-S-isoprenylcysteine O-methyltransferase Ste14